MPLTEPTYLYCTQDDVEAVLSIEGTIARADDDNTGSLTAKEIGYIQKAIKWATQKVNFYCVSRYCPAALSTSYLVNEWAVILACKHLSRRRTNPVPASIHDWSAEVIEELMKVHSGEFEIPLLPLRESNLPAWSNGRYCVTAALAKWRVERRLSDRTPTPYRQARDWGSEFVIEP